MSEKWVPSLYKFNRRKGLSLSWISSVNKLFSLQVYVFAKIYIFRPDPNPYLSNSKKFLEGTIVRHAHLSIKVTQSLFEPFYAYAWLLLRPRTNSFLLCFGSNIKMGQDTINIRLKVNKNFYAKTLKNVLDDFFDKMIILVISAIW